MNPQASLRRGAPFLLLLSVFLLFLVGCGGHGGGHKASAKEVLAAIKKRSKFSVSVDPDARAPYTTEADFQISGEGGVATFRDIDRANPNDVPLHMYRADVANVVFTPDATGDAGGLSFDLVHYGGDTGYKTTDKATFAGRIKFDGNLGYAITSGTVTSPGGSKLNLTPKNNLLPFKGTGAFVDPHYAGTIDGQNGVPEDWSGVIAQGGDDAHVHWTLLDTKASKTAVEFDLVDAGNTIQGEFDGTLWGYSQGDKVEVYAQIDANGAMRGWFKDIDKYDTPVYTGRITFLKGVDPTAIAAGYYEGTMTPTGQGDGAKAFVSFPARFNLAATTGANLGAVLFTPKVGAPSYAGGITGVAKATITVQDLTGYYKRIDFTKTNKTVGEISGTYRAELADNITLEAGTFKVKTATPAVLASSIAGRSLAGKLTASRGTTTNVTAITVQNIGTYPFVLGLTSGTYLGVSELRGYAVGDAFSVCIPNGTDPVATFSGTVKAGATSSVTGRYAIASTVDGTKRTESGSLSLGVTASAGDLKPGIYQGSLTLPFVDNFEVKSADFRLVSASVGSPKGVLIPVHEPGSEQLADAALTLTSVTVSGEDLVLKFSPDPSVGSAVQLILTGRVSGDTFSGKSVIRETSSGNDSDSSGAFSLTRTNVSHPEVSGTYTVTFQDSL